MTRVIALATVLALAVPLAASAEGTSARDLYKRASPAVLVVFATDGGSTGSVGTGSLISPDGLILTNHHVIAINGKIAPNVGVFFKPAEVTGQPEKDLAEGIPATVLAASPAWDLALLAIPRSKAKDKPYLAITRERAQPGDPAIAIGHPEDGGLWTLTSGIISNRIKDFQGVSGKNVYQMQTPINPGNSGGPLLDAEGTLVGVNTAAVKVGKSGLPVAEIQFAVASDVVLAFLDAAIEALASGRTAVAQGAASGAQGGAGQAQGGAGQGQGDAGGEKIVASGATGEPGAVANLSGKGQIQVLSGRRNLSRVPPAPAALAPAPGPKGVPAKVKRAIQADFQTPKHPYDRKALYDYVRRQAQKAWDELDREIPD